MAPSLLDAGGPPTGALHLRTRWAKVRRRRGLRLVGIAILLALTGCSTYAERSARIREAFAQGDLGRALEMIEAGEEEADVLALLQRGLLRFEAGDYPGSARDFDRADQRIEELYTKSLSKEALAFLTNDATLDYTGYPAEQVLLHTYASLARLADGDRDGALVEARRASHRLQVLEELRADAEAYHDDPFAEWLTAMLYADDGDANACLVAARRAHAAFEDAAEHFGVTVPGAFVRDYVVWARRFGFDEEAASLARDYGALAADARAPLPDEGEVVLVYESGFVDHLEEVRLDFPIYTTDDTRDRERLARRIRVRGPRGHFVPPPKVEIAYWLSVAVPVLARDESRLVSARLLAADLAAHTEVVEDVSAIFRLTFEEGSGTRLLRTLVRALAKYATVQAVKNEREEKGEKKKNEVAGFLANLVASATERADTRSWTTLPDRIHLARLRLPAGRHDLRVEVLDRRGQVAQTVDFEGVVVRRGQRTLVHHRSVR